MAFCPGNAHNAPSLRPNAARRDALVLGPRRPPPHSRRRTIRASTETNSHANSENPTTASVSLVSLGCPKNTVDAEVLLGDMQRQGLHVAESEDAETDVVVINSCAFVQDAKEESIAAILEAVQRKQDSSSKVKGVVVSGCLAQRYADDLAKELPEVDAVVGFENYASLPETVRDIVAGTNEERSRVYVGGATVPFRPEYTRKRLTPRHTAFLRVAEGCDHKCTFCAIPGFRGQFRSKAWDTVLEEARRLAQSGVVELNLIAEDTNQWGMDFGTSDTRRLHDLLYALAEIEGIKWIRLLYCYPSYFSDELVNAIASIDKVVKYIDIPLQHIADPVLRRMMRPSRAHTENLLNRIRDGIPGVVIRTTFISGFPGETQKDHRDLVKFLKDFQFTRAGVFTYSAEDGTPAAELPGMLDEDVKEARRDELVAVQQQIQEEYAEGMVHRVVDVLIDRYEDGHSVGRTVGDAPDIDSIVHVFEEVDVGSIVPVRVGGTSSFDLWGTIESSDRGRAGVTT